MRRPPKTILVEFYLEGRSSSSRTPNPFDSSDGNTFIVGLDLLQAPAVGEAVHFAKYDQFQGDFIVTKVRWICGLVIEATGRIVGPDSTGDRRAFQTAFVEVKPA